MSRYSKWLESLGVPPEGRRFYEVHMTADQVHQDTALSTTFSGDS
jgi:hypothetical protein